MKSISVEAAPAIEIDQTNVAVEPGPTYFDNKIEEASETNETFNKSFNPTNIEQYILPEANQTAVTSVAHYDIASV